MRVSASIQDYHIVFVRILCVVGVVVVSALLVISIHVTIVLSAHPAIQRNLNEGGGRLPAPVRLVRHDLL